MTLFTCRTCRQEPSYRQHLQPVVLVANQLGKPVAGVPVSVSLALLSGKLNGTTTVTTNAAGQAIFSSLSITGTGSYTLTAASPGLTSPWAL